MNKYNFGEIYDTIINYDIAYASEITLVCNIAGWSEETLNNIIYSRTGYHDIDQLKESEPLE